MKTGEIARQCQAQLIYLSNIRPWPLCNSRGPALGEPMTDCQAGDSAYYCSTARFCLFVFLVLLFATTVGSRRKVRLSYLQPMFQ